MATCDICGTETREVAPFVRTPPRQVMKVLWHEMPLPRSALAVLDPAREAAIPWGEHPDDGGFGTACLKCAAELSAS